MTTRKTTEILTGKVMQKSVLITGCSSGIGLE
ncbi:short-chain dehydrogenase, partial [Citrobacter sp. S44_ASV_140]|nr:short-chain dehydrogenase [Citrobacter sp. S44_ASV_140]